MGLLTAALILGGLGAGVSAYGQYQAGRTQEVMSRYNAQQQEKQAQQQLLSMQTQAALQKQSAEANFRLRAQEAQARFTNAESLQNQALTQDSVNRANLGKREEMMRRLQGQQRAKIAASGAVESTGSPLDLLAETAAQIEMDKQEQVFSQAQQRQTLFREADMERLGGEFALAGSTLDRDSSLSAARLNDAAASAQYLSGMREAEITRLAGRAQRMAGMYSAAGTLFSGANSMFGLTQRFNAS